MADGAGRRWQDEVEPELRPSLIQQTVAKIDELFRAKEESPPEGLYEDVANVENEAFMTAKDKIDYLRRVSYMLSRCRNQAQLQAAARRQQQMEMMHQIQLANTVQAIHGCNPSFTAVPQAVPMMASPSRPTFQSPNQHMAHPFASNMQINVNQGPSDMMPMLYHTFNSQPAMVAPMAQSVGQQPIVMQSDNQHPVMQLQPTNIAQCHWENMAQLQGQPIAQPNGHQSYLLSQNVCAYAQHLQPTVQQQYFWINQQPVGLQRYQMLGANVAKTNDGYSGGWNNQQNAGWASGIQSPSTACEQVELKRQTNMESQLMPPAERQITINQQSNAHCPSPQSQARMESAREVDWREEMVQQIKSLKDAYFLELVELDQNFVLQRLTEEQFKSLPREKVDTYNQMLQKKCYISHVLEFLQLKKSLETYRGKLPVYKKAIHLLLGQGKRKANAEMNTGQESKSCPRQSPPETINLTADKAPFTGGKSYQQKLSADESIDQVRQNVVTTPSVEKKTDSKQLQEVKGPCFSIKSPGALQSSPITDVGLSCVLSLTDKSGVASPNALLKSRSQSSISHPVVIAVASPCLSTKSTLTSTVDKLGFVAGASSCSSVKSASPSAIAKSGILPVASPSDGDSSSLLHNNGAVNCCNLTPDPPCQTHTPAGQAEDQEHGGAETPVAKRPIDRLVAAVLSSSPAVLRSSVNLIESALREMDSVPSRIQSNSKMKRIFCVTSASELPTFGSTDGSTVTFEFDASDSALSSNRSVKRQKTQNTKDALLDETEAVNSRLIDTVISITSDDREDGARTMTLVKLSYTAVSLAPSLKLHFATTGNLQPLVMPMTLLIPADYPRSSPVIVEDEGDAQLRTKFSCISVVVDAAFRRELHNLQEPRSLKETAMVWDSCVRRAITEYAYLLGGGTLSSSIEHVRVGSAQEKRGTHAHMWD
ncbi:hypothetical protein SEVIR_7G040000v4 [Setaria viridis]|uniref:ARC105/Med15 mediator subunit C-terminal domain-containing protein n=1 Tax=Setaria viridis TaxID=4556 RepID=A0A4U6TNZ5_SETVI|nr:mediator of RNA polymerase II transcription subunit 15a-like [Setaria viridis]TKW03044.1 hypothetical protein SEVIR_7G040000v2 [Setaria viridis]